VRSVVALALLLAFPACATGPQLIPATPVQGAAVLTTQDEYLDAMTPADLSVRLAVAQGGSLETLKLKLAGGALAWSKDDRMRLLAMGKRHSAALKALRRWLPREVLLIKASAAVEGGLPHTRGVAISLGAELPPVGANGSEAELDWLFFHELFHVLSRRNAGQRDALYALIGFVPCSRLDAPAGLTDARITNPDAVETRHVLPVTGIADVDWILPYLFARPARFDPAVGSRFTAYFNVAFLAVSRTPEGHCQVRELEGKPLAFDFPAVRTALFAKTGANTSYVMHPEETLADNFADLMMGKRAVPNPEVQDRLAAFLGVTLPPGR
jgi:hypothetical protein